MAVDANPRPPVHHPPPRRSRRPLEVRISYDRDSDELVAFLFGPRPHVADYFSDEAAFLLDPDTDEVLGIQIDDYLAIMAPMRPELYAVLRAASLRGIDLPEVERLIRRSQTPSGRLLAALRSLAYRRRRRQDQPATVVVPELPSPLPPEVRPLLAGLGLP